MRIIFLTLLFSLVMINPSFSEIKKDKSGWWCGPTADWQTFRLNFGEDFYLNNFNFQEKNSFLSDLLTLSVKFTTVNNNKITYQLGSQFAGFRKDGSLTFAVSVQPLFGQVIPGVETSSGEIYADDYALKETSKVCGNFSVSKN